MCKFAEKNLQTNLSFGIVLTEHNIVHLDKPQVVLSRQSEIITSQFAALLKC